MGRSCCSTLAIATVLALQWQAASAEPLQPKQILHLSDVHLNLSAATKSIAYGEDAPFELLTSALEYASEMLPEPDFLLYTGDHAVHDDLDDEELAEVVRANVATIEEYFPSTNSSTAIIGNTDTAPEYMMEVTDGTEVNAAFGAIADAWNESLSGPNLEVFARWGYLSYKLDANLTLLTLNTVPYSPSHVPDTTDNPDPFNQFDWLQGTLELLRQHNKSAYIVGHIPPIIDSHSGAALWHEDYIATYKQIVGQFASVVKAQLFAHVHSVEVRVPLESEQNATQVGFERVPLFTTAAISPLYENNPSFTVWDYHPTTYELLDFAVYGSNISDDGTVAGWTPLFNATEAFGVESLTASELNKFVQRAGDDPELLQQYYYNSKALSYRQAACLDEACQAKWRCTLQWWATVADFDACVASGSNAVTATAGESSTPWWRSPSTVAFVVGGAAAAAAFAILLVMRRLKKHHRDAGNASRFESMA